MLRSCKEIVAPASCRHVDEGKFFVCNRRSAGWKPALHFFHAFLSHCGSFATETSTPNKLKGNPIEARRDSLGLQKRRVNFSVAGGVYHSQQRRREQQHEVPRYRIAGTWVRFPDGSR